MAIFGLTDIGGILTMEELKKDEKITKEQKIGLQYFDELEMKIPREEIDIWNVTT
jgi:hypothetical protein